MNASLKNTRIEFHILQSFPVTCLNRDDVGAPKTAVVGGVTRARVSSQCWKRQVRLALREYGVDIANRTQLIKSLISKACENAGATKEQAANLGELVSIELSGEHDADPEKGATLLFLSDSEVASFAHIMSANNFSFSILDEKIATLTKAIKELKARKKKKEDVDDELKNSESELKAIKENRDIAAMFNGGFDPSVNGLDIALFGRMVAKAASMNIEAAASFSHAISTHKVSNEVEFFTALDDLKAADESGSAHMGSLEFNSATYYRYISLDLGQLEQSLGGQSMPEAVEAFVKALYVAVPSARQTTQSGASPWEFAKVLVRQGQRLQVPFEQAIKANNSSGFLAPSITALQEYLTKKEKLSGSLFGKIADYEWGLDENFSVDNLIAELKKHAAVTHV